MDNDFNIKNGYSGVIIEKDDKSFSVEKRVDGDIWFNTTSSRLDLSLDIYTRSFLERKCYIYFESLMKSLIGRYILSGDNKNEYSMLPNDFIDLDNKTITWYSDSDSNDVLKLQYLGNKINVSIYRIKEYRTPIKVRIRTSGSMYGYYYQEFTKFFDDLSVFAYQEENSKNNEVQLKRYFTE